MASKQSFILRRILGLSTLFITIITNVHSQDNSNFSNQDAVEEKVESFPFKKPIHLSDYIEGNFGGESYEYNWVTSATKEDGLFTTIKDEKIILNSASLQGEKVIRELADTSKFVDENKAPIDYSSFSLSADLQFIALQFNYSQNWYKSYFASYYIFDLKNLNKPGILINKNYHASGDYNKTDSQLQSIVWAPKGHNLAFAQYGNLYTLTNSFNTLTQITENGSELVLNGFPDWGYEEELWILKDAYFWSPNADSLAFVTFNATNVPISPLLTYTDRKDNGDYSNVSIPYSSVYEQHTPLVGFPITEVSISIAKLKAEKVDIKQVDFNSGLEKDLVLTDLQFSTDEQSPSLLIRFTNRIQNIVYTSVADSRSYETPQVVRRERAGQDALKPSLHDGGWYESKALVPLPKIKCLNLNEESYLDYVTVDGYTHIALFSPLTASKPKYILTKGSYDVETISGYNVERGVLFYTSTEIDSTAVDIFSVKLDGSQKVHHTKDKNTGHLQKTGTYSISLSKKGGFSIINYNGPSIPWSRLTVNGSLKGSLLLGDNNELAKKVEEYAYPTTVYSRVNINGNELNALEIRPYGFSSSKKYKVVFYIYGGPGSQYVTRDFDLNRQRIVVSHRNDTILVTVDGRGTKNKGRKFMVSVNSHLGDFEAQDVIAAGKLWSQKPYVNKDKMAICGKSYGGYLTLKTLELQSEIVFKYGASLSPVSDWKFYDAYYTERYMQLPKDNIKGYHQAAVTNFTNFQKTQLYLAHGTRDDNVHFSNSMYLINQFAIHDVYDYDFYPVVDNDHYYRFSHAKRHIYTRLLRFFDRVFES